MGSNRSGWNTAQQGASRCSSPTPFAAFASLLLPFPPFMSSFCVVFVTFSVNKPTTTCPPSHTPNRASHPPLSFSPPSSTPSASPSLKGQPSVSSVITTIHICRGSFFFPFSTQREARAHARGGQEGSGSRGRGERRRRRLTNAGGRVAAVLWHGPVLPLQAHQAHHREGLLQGDASVRFMTRFDVVSPPSCVMVFASGCFGTGVPPLLLAWKLLRVTVRRCGEPERFQSFK